MHPFFLNYFESVWFYQDRPFIKNVSFTKTQKNYIYIKSSWTISSSIVNPPVEIHYFIKEYTNLKVDTKVEKIRPIAQKKFD